MILDIVHAAQKLNFTQCILIVPALLAVVAMMMPLLRKSMGITVSSELTDSAAEALAQLPYFSCL